MCQTLHKITQPKLDSGVYLQKNISFRPSSFSFIQQRSLKQNKRKQKQQRTDSPFSKVQHIWWFLCPSTIMQNTLELVSSNKSAYVFSFPLGFLTLWSMPVLHQPGSACNFSGSCHVLSAKSYQVHRIMIFGNWDELGICSIGIVPCRFALAVPYSNLRYWHKTGKILGCFFQMFKVSHVFHHLFPSSFTLSFIDVLPLFPHEIHHFRGEAVVTAAFQATRQDLVNAACSERIRKARNLWCGTFWIIGHDWSLKVWMDSIQVVWYESTFWMGYDIIGKIWKNPPAPKVLGRDLPDGTRKRLQVYLGGGGAFFGQNLLFLIGRDARLQKTL